MSVNEYIAVISIASVLYLVIGYLILVAYYIWGDTEDIVPILVVIFWWLCILISGGEYLIAGPKWLSEYIDGRLTLGEDWQAGTLLGAIVALIAVFILFGVIVT
jgi:hypothetical protein